MKKSAFILSLTLLIFACKKVKPNVAADFVAKSYVSTGNVLVVEVDIKYNSIQFEEYDLANFIPQESTGEITFSNFFV